MKVYHLVPGSGGTFYCQNCIRDCMLVRALRRQGLDVAILPLYLPMFADGLELERGTPVFFGGINVYLQQHLSVFRETPRWVDGVFDTPWMLRQAAKREGSTNAAKLGPMTLSMLDGSQGRQRKEFARLLEWMAEHDRPDVVLVSNALLLGLAAEIKRALDVPIVCALQDEEPWVDAMEDVYARRCWEAMGRESEFVDAFFAPSVWYADRMASRIGIARDRIAVIPLGVETDDIGSAEPAFEPPTIGFLSRLNEAQGLGAVVDAFLQLRAEPALADLRLRATGGYTAADRAFLQGLDVRLRAADAANAIEFPPDFHKTQRHAFLRSLSVLSTPALIGEAFGLPLLEAMAFGVPVVQPRVGAYPEILEATGGGLLYDPKQPGAHADALRSLLRDPARATELGQRGRAAVLERFNTDRVAKDLLALYASATGSPSP